MEFEWIKGMAKIRAQMRIRSLHEAALKTEKTGEVKSILEISTKSEIDLGTKFSAFNLRLRLDNDLESSVEGWSR